MSGTSLPDAALVAEIERIRDRIINEVLVTESNYAAAAQAALVIWAGYVGQDRELGGFTRDQAREVAVAVIDHYIPATRSN